MTWKRHMKLERSRLSRSSNVQNNTYSSGYNSNFSSYLPDVYTGFANRIDRYRIYDQMDQDPEIKTSLDILADFTAQSTEDYELPLKIKYKEGVNPTEVTTIEDRLDAWGKLNNFKVRMYETVRGVFKYGDQFFIRDPETLELYYVNPNNIDKIVVNERLGKKPIIYYIRDVSLNIRDKVYSNVQQGVNNSAVGALPNSLSGNGNQYGSLSASSAGGSSGTSQFGTGGYMDIIPVDAEHVVHVSLNTGMNAFWPFGESVLEGIFKTYKQQELLEDSIIIYRVQRAPERRVFKIDVGDMMPQQAMAAVERVKNDMHQRRIPSNKGGSTSLMDAAYNPLCLDMNTRIPLLDGRTLSIWELMDEYKEGKENWAYSCHPVTGEIVPGNITWAGITKEKSKVIKITFDNGEELICTEDHKIPVLGYGFKEAKDLTPNDSLISFNTTTLNTQSGHPVIYSHEKSKWMLINDVVGGYFHEIGKNQIFVYLPNAKNSHKNVIHHKDLNLMNNDPRNIQYMNKVDYISYNNYMNNVVDESHDISDCLNECNENNDVAKKIIKSIEYMEDEITVGTITIDGNERWHNYHTFAIESGIFVKNSILEDYFFPQTAEGRGSSVETLPGGENLGQIDDLRYFKNKLIRGLSIPSSYLPFGPEDGGTLFSDGGTHSALVQEHRFNTQCLRWQSIIIKSFDEEFKRYLIEGGYNLDISSFEMTFTPPMNFAAYRKTELDATLINTYLPLNELPYISKQLILQKMGFSTEEIMENERLWLLENPAARIEGGLSNEGDENLNLQSVGIQSPEDENLNSEDEAPTEEDITSSGSGSKFDPNSLGSNF